VRIDDCEPSFEALRSLQWTDLFPSYEKGFKKLVRLFLYSSKEKPALVKIDKGREDGAIYMLNGAGIGFIRSSHIKKDVFFHHSELLGIEFHELRVDDSVHFSVAEGPQGPVAVDVERA
jgi:cold shock CspA family protein